MQTMFGGRAVVVLAVVVPAIVVPAIVVPPARNTASTSVKRDSMAKGRQTKDKDKMRVGSGMHSSA